MARVVVVGGGISGLGAARALALAHLGGAGPLEVVVLEASASTGGKIRSGEFAGRAVEFGPDNFLTRDPSAARLARELGLGDDLGPPATSSAGIVVHGRLHAMPSGLVLGIPTDLAALARSGILSPAGLARAGLDLTLPGRPMDARRLGLEPARPLVGGAEPTWTAGGGGEWTAAAILERRLGREVVDRLVDPLLGGINAGGVDHLSLAVVAPQVARALVGRRSVIEALRPLAPPKVAPAPASGDGETPDPLFLGLGGGLQRLVAALEADVVARGVEVRLATSARAITRCDGGYLVATGTGAGGGRDEAMLRADAVVLATPAFASAPLLHDVSPAASAELGSIPHASVALVTFAWRRDAVARLPAGSGFLVPRKEGRLLTGCTVLSTKWPAMAVEGEVLVRASTGRYGDDRPGRLDDAELVARAGADLAELLGVRGEPLATHVERYDRAFPQYLPGHLGRIERARAALAKLPPIELAGAALGGIGIPACLTSGERAAAALLERLTR